MAFLLWRPLERWAAQYENIGVLPSQLLSRLEEGLKRKKRYLGYWITRWLTRRLNAYIVKKEAEALSVFFDDSTSYQAPSDPGRRRAILAAFADLTPVNRQIVVWLLQEKTAKEMSALRGGTVKSAEQQIQRARKAFRIALKKYSSEK